MGETVPANKRHLKEGRRRLIESERLIADWRELIAGMQADDLDLTVAHDLLKTFEDELKDLKREFGAV